MKLTTFLLLFAVIQTLGFESFSQGTKLSLNFKSTSLKEVLSSIEDKTEFYFLYSSKVIDVDRKIDVDVKGKSISEVLDQILKDTDIEYVFKDRQILLSSKSNHDYLFGNAQQQKSVSGKVTESSGKPLPGVTVVIKGSTTGIVTDENGNFIFTKIPADATLVFSFVGMKTQELLITGKSSLNVVMVEETVGIEEVVAVGYGTQKKQTITGSVASVKGEQLVSTPVANATNTLAGRLPGLISLQSSGRPGADAAALSIRGFGSALTIVDGVESNFANIDPNIIESISILKDGAASIYGARAGNGVILITTKRGNIQKPTIGFSSSYTVQGITTMPTPVSSGQYTEMISEEWLQSGKPAETVPYTPAQIQKYYEHADPYLYPNTNWYNELIRKWAPQQQHNVSVRGGSERIKYYGFIGYMNQESIWKKSGGDYSRYNLQSNIDAKITDQLSFQLDFSSIYEERRFPTVGQDPGAGSIWEHFWSNLPIYPASLPDPSKVPYAGGDAGVNALSNSQLIGYSNSDSQNIKGTVALTYDIKWIKGLSAKAWVNYNQDYVSAKNFTKPVKFYTYDPASEIYNLVGTVGGTKAQLAQSKNQGRTITEQFSLNYNRIFNTVHRVDLLMLYESIDYKTDFISASRINFLSSTIDQMFGGSTTDMSNNGSAEEMGRKSYVGRFNYSFNNKYLLESTIRADASAKFSPDNRWGYFPSVSVGWVASEEKFMDWAGNLDNLKIRASYGESGNDAVGSFQYLSGYAYGRTYILGSDPQQGLISTGLANPGLTWEKIKIYDAGSDFSFWKRKLYGEFDVFFRERKGIPATRITTLPSSFGASLPAENINSLNDRGFELKVGSSGNRGDFYWDVDANASWSRSKWDHYEEPEYSDPDQDRIYKKSGRWTDIAYGYLSDGLFTSQQEINNLGFDEDGQGNTTLRPGDVRYKDINGDKKLDWKDQVVIGKGSVPHWMLGLNINLRYKNLDFSTLLQGAMGYYNYITLIRNTVEAYDNRWTSENNNPNALVPRLGGAATNGLTSDYYYRKAGYLRLKSISLGYNLPQRWLSSLKFTKARVYIAGSNMFTFDKLKKYATDPEAPSSFSGRYYPQQKTITVGINLSL